MKNLAWKNIFKSFHSFILKVKAHFTVLYWKKLIVLFDNIFDLKLLESLFAL